MQEKAKKKPRINVQLPRHIEDYLELRMEQTSLPKTSVLIMALEEWYQAKKNIEQMGNLPELILQLKEMSEKMGKEESK